MAHEYAADVQPSGPRFYLPQLDALRFLAFFVVFCHHNLNVHGKHWLTVIRDSCGFGLCLFFFLSSYLITSLLVLEKRRTGSVHLPAFYKRRILRIWPLYFAYLTALEIAGIWAHGFHIGAGKLAALCLLSGNWYFLAKGMSGMAITHLWSISVEEQFYAVWPSLFRRVSPKAVLVALGLIVLSSVAVTIAVAGAGPTPLVANTGSISLNAWLNTGSQAIFFAAGGALALFLPGVSRPRPWLAASLTLSGFAVWLGMEAWANVNDRAAIMMPLHLGFAYVGIAAGCALLLAGSLCFAASSVPRWLIYLGRISYGLYVYSPFIEVIVHRWEPSWLAHTAGAANLVCLLGTIAMAALSYQFLEKPFLRLKRRFEFVRSRPVDAALPVPAPVPAEPA